MECYSSLLLLDKEQLHSEQQQQLKEKENVAQVLCA